MPYVKISDPNIIDLAAWHQLINVVNQHSDSINTITNNFGVQGTGTPDWNADDTVGHEYDPGSQKILYGRTKVYFTGDNAASITGNIYHGSIDYGDNVTGSTSFSARPIVTATIQSGNTNFSSSNQDIVLTIYNVDQNQFNFKLNRANATPTALSGTACYINWQAIGPK
jgi:hypothetical protein